MGMGKEAGVPVTQPLSVSELRSFLNQLRGATELELHV